MVGGKRARHKRDPHCSWGRREEVLLGTAKASPSRAPSPSGGGFVGGGKPLLAGFPRWPFARMLPYPLTPKKEPPLEGFPTPPLNGCSGGGRHDAPQPRLDSIQRKQLLSLR